MSTGSEGGVKRRKRKVVVLDDPKLVTRRIAVIQYVDVTLDESKFDEAFMEDFRRSFYPFTTVEEHAEHIGQMVVREVTGGKWDPKTGGRDFIEGYGPPKKMGIEVERWAHFECETDITETHLVDKHTRVVRR